MKLYIYLIAIMLFCLSFSPVAAMEELKTYKDSYKSYSVAYPAKWRSDENEETREVQIRAKTGESLTIKAVENYINSKMTMETMTQLEVEELTNGYIDELRIYLPDKVKDITVTERGLAAIGTEKAVYISVTADWYEGEKFSQTKHLLCFLLHKGDLYILITSASPDTFDQSKSIFQKSFDSFKFLY